MWNVRDATRWMEWLERTKRSTTDDLPTAASPRIQPSVSKGADH